MGRMLLVAPSARRARVHVFAERTAFFQKVFFKGGGSAESRRKLVWWIRQMRILATISGGRVVMKGFESGEGDIGPCAEPPDEGGHSRESFGPEVGHPWRAQEIPVVFEQFLQNSRGRHSPVLISPSALREVALAMLALRQCSACPNGRPAPSGHGCGSGNLCSGRKNTPWHRRRCGPSERREGPDSPHAPV